MIEQFFSLPLPEGFSAQEGTPAVTTAFLEGPAVAEDGTVYFSDILNNRILRLTPGHLRAEVFREPSGRANGLLFDFQGQLLICEGNEFGPNDGNRRITRTNLVSGEIEIVTDRFEGQRYNSPNDIAALSNGMIFFTDPCYGDPGTMELTHESVYRIEPTGEVTRVLTQPEIQRPNGIAISPDQRTLYLIDSCPIVGGNRKVWAFNVAGNGALSDQRVVIDFAPGRGGDGMAVDCEGTLYIAAGIYRSRGAYETTDVPSGIYVVTPTGEIRGRIPVPEDPPTNVTFGGEDLKTLYITVGKTLWTHLAPVPGFLVHRK